MGLRRIVLCLLIPLVAGCAHVSRGMGPEAAPTVSGAIQSDAELRELDAVLLELVVLHFQAESTIWPVRVDPRPLHSNPGLVTLHPVGDIVPDWVAPGLERQPLAADAEPFTRNRRGVLQRLGIPEVDGLAQVACPGALVPDADSGKQRWCPRQAYKALLLGLPRQGGAYVPGSFDERAKYPGTVFSVRVIGRGLTPRGSVETSDDFVFERQATGSWKLLEVRGIAIVE